ncbi:UDP-N-acetylmuramoyl-tripeptide--D-alanyl-D-alanine ligase [Acaricomes phytoseiuli]|uniref:UDP-N-acetylmuramoyl-tripeptide--D-alanyl-D- alanine ligase n=1 Tax=Acaricomes phytoseiuli TaxID=291968 RepID=UPI00037AF5ED|nr:UDP-N-acetylmuramoyl-tripeptide--D-alanyl-D-alanine ligase [Acaricomes phytoseiuli]MCW1249547.1 UDP-N-acetylmuramoyl-tripeptide--D-alanyl-D-alanine ligase [Acaricomes phytoseiuli]
MTEFRVEEIAGITGGRLTSTVAAQLTLAASRISTDSRDCVPGSLYVAKLGEHADGHDFIAAALAAGAELVLAERELTDASGQPYPAVIVPDAILAMGQLAAAVVQRIRDSRGPGEFTVIGITGSAGKTTTKDLLAGVLSSAGPTVYPEGSYNGEVGVPLTVFRADETTRYLVVEMGATKIGNIAYLAQMVRPDIGVVLGVGSAHAGEFGGVENIAIAKGELVEALPPGGTAVLNIADSRVAAMASRTSARILWFGETGVGAELVTETAASVLRADQLHTDDQARPVFTLILPDDSAYPVRSGLIGVHHVNNLLAAAAAAWAAGIPGDAIARSLEGRGSASRWRMERTDRPDGVTVINDAYNANPESMRAALRALAELGRDESGAPARRTWAVLGPMYELGEDSVREHDALGQIVVRLNISRLVVVGADARPLHIGAINEGSWGDESVHLPDLESAYQLLGAELRPGDVVLFKSSRDAGLRHLGDRVAQAEASESEGTAPRTPLTWSPMTAGED